MAWARDALQEPRITEYGSVMNRPLLRCVQSPVHRTVQLAAEISVGRCRIFWRQLDARVSHGLRVEVGARDINELEDRGLVTGGFAYNGSHRVERRRRREYGLSALLTYLAILPTSLFADSFSSSVVAGGHASPAQSSARACAPPSRPGSHQTVIHSSFSSGGGPNHIPSLRFIPKPALCCKSGKLHRIYKSPLLPADLDLLHVVLLSLLV